MREIKFRAWDKEKEKMFTESDELFTFEKSGQYWDIKNETDNIISNEQTGVLQQFTGLKDKNKKDIYEGDILLCVGIPDVYFLVEFGDDYDKEVFGFTLKSIMSRSKLSYPFCRDVEKYEVIGNEYENREFVKSTQTEEVKD